MKEIRSLSIAVTLVAILFAGCSVGPDYKRPPALSSGSIPTEFGDPVLGKWKLAAPSAHLPRGRWWEVFGDKELNRLETLAANSNQQLAAAYANFRQARAAVGTARADFFPQISGSPSYQRQRTSANQSPNSTQNLTYNTFNVGLDASWEVDVWGRVRREVEAARARFSASADDLEAVKLSIESEVAIDYFALRALDEQSALFTRTAEAYRKALELTRNRRKSGVASELDVSQAETQLISAEAQIPATDLQRANFRHALAVLCGQPATTFALTPNTTVTSTVPVTPVSVPTEWLESRPDIASAERRMAAANADVGVAKAAFFPKLLLNGSGGYLSVSASSLFNSPSQVWALGPTLQIPLFTGGRNTAQLAAARAAYEATVANYRQTVLTAFQDVEDQLAAHKLLETQLEREKAALVSARRTLEISQNRYKAGVILYLDVITSQTTALVHEQSVVQLSGQRLSTAVGLIKAMGGGWNHGLEPKTER